MVAPLDGDKIRWRRRPLSAVKKAWSSVYDRVADHLPDSILAVETEEERPPGDRGKQKKQRLLVYLREHPEELRPYAWKGRGKPSTGPN